MGAICPLHKLGGMVAEAMIQSGKAKDYISWGRHPTIASEAICIQTQCQWWGFWTWAEETNQNNFVRTAAYGCTFGQSQCVQGTGSKPV